MPFTYKVLLEKYELCQIYVNCQFHQQVFPYVGYLLPAKLQPIQPDHKAIERTRAYMQYLHNSEGFILKYWSANRGKGWKYIAEWQQDFNEIASVKLHPGIGGVVFFWM